MNEKEYDAIMYEAEEAHKHQTKLNNPHAFHRAFELAQRKVEAWIPEIFDTLEICCGAISDAVCGKLEKETAEAVINLVKEQFGKNGHEFNMQFPDEINLDGWIPVEEVCREGLHLMGEGNMKQRLVSVYKDSGCNILLLFDWFEFGEIILDDVPAKYMFRYLESLPIPPKEQEGKE